MKLKKRAEKQKERTSKTVDEQDRIITRLNRENSLLRETQKTEKEKYEFTISELKNQIQIIELSNEDSLQFLIESNKIFEDEKNKLKIKNNQKQSIIENLDVEILELSVMNLELKQENERLSKFIVNQAINKQENGI